MLKERKSVGETFCEIAECIKNSQSEKTSTHCTNKYTEDEKI